MKPSNTCFPPKPDFSVYIRSGTFALGMWISTLIIGPLILLVSPLPFPIRYGVTQCWVRSNLWMLKTICGLRFEVQGRENIPRENGVVLCKHQSAWETIALQTLFPSIVFILKRELLWIPVWGWSMAALEPVAIDRSAKSSAMKQILRKGMKRIQAGRWVVVFPEGTRVAPGKRGKYLPGGAMLAHKAGCPVVPVAHNAGEFWGRKAFLKFPGTIQVRIGPAIDSRQFNAQEINRQAEEWIESRMAEIGRVAQASE